MIKKVLICLLTIFCLSSNIAYCEEYKESPESKFNININLLQFVLTGGIAKGLFPLVYLPFIFDINYYFSKDTDFNIGLVYRYENYFDEYIKLHPALSIWHNHHEVFISVGAKHYFNSRQEGYFADIKGGLGTATSPLYNEFSLIINPDFGYTKVLSPTPFRLSYGGGIIFNLPIYQNSKTDYAPKWDNLTFIGYIVHRFIPVLNFSVGYDF